MPVGSELTTAKNQDRVGMQKVDVGAKNVDISQRRQL